MISLRALSMMSLHSGTFSFFSASSARPTATSNVGAALGALSSTASQRPRRHAAATAAERRSGVAASPRPSTWVTMVWR